MVTNQDSSSSTLKPIILTDDEIIYYNSLESIRKESEKVYELAKKYPDESNFVIDETKLANITEFLKSLIHRDYSSCPSSIDFIKSTPYHARWRHFNTGNIDRIGNLLRSFHSPIDNTEKTVMLFDLFIVGVLIDAGAGHQWHYKESDENGQNVYECGRSEGLALATYHMFVKGKFSSNPSQSPFQVDSQGLSQLSMKDLIEGFQVDSVHNPLVGVEGRFELLKRLGSLISSSNNSYFHGRPKGCNTIRPGNLVYYLQDHCQNETLSMHILWDALMKGLSGIWPESRTRVKSSSTGKLIPLGDIWRLSIYKSSPTLVVPFHKLTQWLSYSLLEPLESVLGLQLTDVEALTALAEYRNGGLLIDFGLMTLKDDRDNSKEIRSLVPTFEVHDPVIVEWRALTIHFIDRIAIELRKSLGLKETQYPLAKILEAGTWKAGREIARQKRGTIGGGPPIGIISDGTLF